MAFWGVGLAFVRGWSLALPHLVVLYVSLGFFLARCGPSFEANAKSQQLTDFVSQLFFTARTVPAQHS
jgi:hypothetical protein